jgi:hypothetical protein
MVRIKHDLENWIARRRKDLPPGETAEIKKEKVVGEIPDNFEVSALSFPNGANKVYRDQKATETLQLRVYDEKYEVQMDNYHPREHLFGHFKKDVPPAGQAALGGLALLAAGAIFG